MRILACICFTIPLLSLVGCSSVNTTTDDYIPSQAYYSPPEIANVTDSIRYGPCKLKPVVHLINTKKARTYYVLKDKFGVEMKRADLKPESDNYISYATLSPDFYHLEIYDDSGIILNGKFIHK